MGKYFGTDGIRGRANDTLDVDRAFKVGKYLAYYYKNIFKTAKIIIGKDTRISGSMFEAAIAAGASALGADVYLVGTCPTPAVAYLVNNFDYCCGIMISASHNPYYDNGIKVFSHDGIKISNDIELKVEAFLDDLVTIDLATNENIGHVYNYEKGLELYLEHLKANFNMDLSGMKIAVDCANGSSSVTAKRLLSDLNADLKVINDQPDGININTNCGSTHPETLQALVKAEDFDLGLAFDGDADRLIAVNHDGELVDGDHVLYICANYLKSIGKLNQNTMVTTVMANLGLFKALDECEINYESTKVGDKYVYDCMLQNDYVLGGEQSGHIIFKEHATTGDGLLTALNIIAIMKKSHKTLKELSQGLKIYPQLLINVEVKDKELVLQNSELLAKIASINAELASNGRMLVRASGTEPLVRVMVEAETDEICEHYVYDVVDFIKKLEI